MKETYVFISFDGAVVMSVTVSAEHTEKRLIHLLSAHDDNEEATIGPDDRNLLSVTVIVNNH